ncbi:hypothetical protein NB705_003302 [Xanthomonas sacchari]|nr:hypothetical protein [Xanthomonas sacchari]
MAEHQAAQPGAQRIAQVERTDVQARGQMPAGLAGLAQHPHLQRRHRGERGHAQQADAQRHRRRRRQGEGQCRQHHRQHAQAQRQRLPRAAVGQTSAEHVADDHAHAEHQQQRRHRTLGNSSDLGQQRLHIGVHGEHAGIAQHRRRQSQQHRRAADRAQFLAQRHGRRCGTISRHQHGDHHGGQRADPCHHPERGAPAVMQAQPGAGRHPEQGGDGEAGEHGRDRRGLALRRHQGGGDHRADAEESAVRQRGHHPRRHQRRVARRQRAGQVAGGEHQHQRQQHALARPAPAGHGQQRRAEEHAQRIAGDQQPRGRNADPQVGGDLQQQAHDHELGGADAEGAGGQRVQRERRAPGSGRMGRRGERGGHAAAPEVTGGRQSRPAGSQQKQ